MKSKFATIEETIDLLTYITEDVSLGFKRWDDRYIRGPGLYFVVISEVRFDSFVDPLGTNRWPVETARALRDGFRPDGFLAAAQRDYPVHGRG